MTARHTTRRQFLQRSLAAGAAATAVPYWLTAAHAAAADAVTANDRPHVGVIGLGGRGMPSRQSGRAFAPQVELEPHHAGDPR